MLALPARAKLNLDLQVLASRTDGYHEVRTTLQAIDLHDLLEIAPAADTTLTTSGLEVAGGQDNSVLKAHRALEHAAGRALPARFHLHKRIPSGSGMGGASSDAAAALRGLASIHRLDVELAPIAKQVGADVPFFLAGGAAVAEGRGDMLVPVAVQPTWFVVAWPGLQLSTADVYRAWDAVHGEAPNHLRRAAESVALQLADFAAGLGRGWQMTGSGSAFFVRCSTHARALEVAAAQRCWTSVAFTVPAWA